MEFYGRPEKCPSSTDVLVCDNRVGSLEGAWNAMCMAPVPPISRCRTLRANHKYRGGWREDQRTTTACRAWRSPLTRSRISHQSVPSEVCGNVNTVYARRVCNEGSSFGRLVPPPGRFGCFGLDACVVPLNE